MSTSSASSLSSSSLSSSGLSSDAISSRSASTHSGPPGLLKPPVNSSATVADDEKSDGYVDNVLSFDELKQPDFYRAVFAEFLATIFFVGFSIAGGISIENHFTDRGSHLLVGTIYHAVLILLVIYAFAPISGAHFNPAISFALVFTRRITLLRCLAYVLSQVGGGIVAAALIEGTQTGSGSSNVGLIIPTHAQEAFLMEIFCTAGLAYGLMSSAFDPRGWGALAPFAIAITVGVNIMAGASVSGGGVMNPARAWGPAVVANNFENHWVYWAGGIFGAIMGSTIYEYLFMQREHARVQNVPSTSGDNHQKKH